MLLTQCPACAAPLPDLTAKQCSRCKTRYCGRTCQEYHWKAGHDKVCRKIRKSGGAEQYHANKKYTEAVTVAAEACAEDTKGQTCYICTEAVHRHTGEGLVRGCGCHTTEGFVHVSCLADQAKILVAEVEESNLGDKVKLERFRRWHKCSLCEQSYHGVVACALGWAGWKTYVGRPEGAWTRFSAMNLLGNGLDDAQHHEESLSVRETELATKRRLGDSEHKLLIVQSNLASTYERLGQSEKSLRIKRDVLSGWLRLNGVEHTYTLTTTNNYANSLAALHRFKEIKSLLRKTMPVARRVLSDSNETTLNMRASYANALYRDPAATLDDLREAVATLEETERTARRVLVAHPLAMHIVGTLARAKLRFQELEVASAPSIRAPEVD